MTTIPTQHRKAQAATNYAANTEMSEVIATKIDKLSRGAGLLTKWRLRRERGLEAVKLNETAMREYMDARRRVFVYQIGLEEDNAKKLMLTHSMAKTKDVEKDIARIISEAASEFEGLILGQEKLALINEAELIHETNELVKSGKIAEHRAIQRIENIQDSTDKIVETVQATIRGLLANLADRFNRALEMD